MASWLSNENSKLDASKQDSAAQDIVAAPKGYTDKPAPAVAAAPELLDALVASLKSAGGYCFAPSQAAIDGNRRRKIESVALSENAGGGFLLKLTGGDAGSTNWLDGFRIRVPDAFERKASARTVRVRVLARSASPAPARMAIAYATVGVGNSGWRWRDVGPIWSVPQLVWRVPKMKDGHGNYIGLLPDRPGAPGVEIHLVSATILWGKEDPSAALAGMASGRRAR